MSDLPAEAITERWHIKRWHKPRLYRYLVANPGLRLMPNRYAGEPCTGSATIGLALTIGRYAYCVKWADAGVSR